MPQIFRPRYTRELPPHAEKCTRGGKPAWRWLKRGGGFNYGVPIGKPGRVVVEVDRYRYRFTGPDGSRVEGWGYADRAATEALVVKLLTQAERIHAGILPPEAARPRLTITALLARWRSHILHGGASRHGAARQVQRARGVCDGIGAARLADLTPAAVVAWIEERRREDRHGKKPFGATTAASYVSAAKSFTHWAATVERCESVDPLSGLKVHRDPRDLRVRRRALSPKELTRLLDATHRSRETVYGLTGPERHALYLLACSTGLRASELASLTRESFDFGAGVVAVERPAKTRRRARDVLPVPAEALAAVKRIAQPKGPIWPNRVKRTQAWWLVAARMIRRDLEAAGIAAEENGRRFDFHCLRGQFATDLDRAGVSLARAQRLMRHSTPELTSRFYTHPEAAELAAEVAKLRRKV